MDYTRAATFEGAFRDNINWLKSVIADGNSKTLLYGDNENRGKPITERMENLEDGDISYIETEYIASDIIELCEKHNIITFSSQPACKCSKREQKGYIWGMFRGDGEKLAKILDQNGHFDYIIAKRIAQSEQKICNPEIVSKKFLLI